LPLAYLLNADYNFAKSILLLFFTNIMSENQTISNVPNTNFQNKIGHPAATDVWYFGLYRVQMEEL